MCQNRRFFDDFLDFQEISDYCYQASTFGPKGCPKTVKKCHFSRFLDRFLDPFTPVFPNFRQKTRQFLDHFFEVYACFLCFSVSKVVQKVSKKGPISGPGRIFGRQPKTLRIRLLHQIPQNAHLGMPRMPYFLSPNDSQTKSCRRVGTTFCGLREPKSGFLGA